MKNNSDMKWWYVFALILLVICVPILINILILLPSCFDFVGEDTDWLSFWGAYIGTVLSSLVAFYVLHKQLDQNHKENEYNRKLQMTVLKYQIKSQWLTELKSKLAAFYTAFSFNDVKDIGDMLLEISSDKKSHKMQIHNKIKEISEKMDAADFSKGVLFPENMDTKEHKFLMRLNDYTNELYSLLEDLDWYSCMLYKFDGRAGLRTEDFKNETIQYKSEEKKHSSCSTRIYDVVAQKGFSIFGHREEILAIRMSGAMENLQPDDIKKVIAELIDYESKKINKIMIEDYDTKQ